MIPLGVLQCLALRRLSVAAGGNSRSDSSSSVSGEFVVLLFLSSCCDASEQGFPAEHHLSVVLMLDPSVFFKGLRLLQ